MIFEIVKLGKFLVISKLKVFGNVWNFLNCEFKIQGFEIKKNQFFFFAYLIILYYMVLESTTLCKLRKKKFSRVI